MKFKELFITDKGFPCNIDGTVFDNNPRYKSRKPLHGVGINDFKFAIGRSTGSKIVHWFPYHIWKHMITRGHSAYFKASHPHYLNVEVCSEWHSFTSFWEWLSDQNYVDGVELDKDIIGDGSLYSPDTCVLVSQQINTFTLSCKSARGEYPIGVNWHTATGKYAGQVRNPFTNKPEHLGLFTDPITAHNAWKKRKLELCMLMKDVADSFDARIYPRLVEIINQLQ